MNYFSGDEIFRVLNYVTRKKKGIRTYKCRLQRQRQRQPFHSLTIRLKKLSFFNH